MSQPFTSIYNNLSDSDKKPVSILLLKFFFHSKSHGQLNYKIQKMSQNDGKNLKNLHVYT